MESRMGIYTDEGLIEAYVFERHLSAGGINGIKNSFAKSPGVRFVGQFVGAFNLFARVVASDLGELQRRIASDYWLAGIHSDFSLNVTANRPAAPKRGSPSSARSCACRRRWTRSTSSMISTSGSSRKVPTVPPS